MALLDVYSPQLIVFFLILGVTPSILWLLYFLRKDIHPEPKKRLLRVFLFGMLATIPAAFVENTLKGPFLNLHLPFLLFWFLYFLLNIALVEELFKYLAARVGALSSRDVDEPVDIIIYLITAALGFAAFENVLHLVLQVGVADYPVPAALWTIALRSIGATFLHALASGFLGYFLAKGMIDRKTPRIFRFIAGLSVAVLLHAMFNFYIIIIETQSASPDYTVLFLLFSSLVLVGIACILSMAFWDIKRHKLNRNTPQS